jgi:hypothetical protein
VTVFFSLNLVIGCLSPMSAVYSSRYFSSESRLIFHLVGLGAGCCGWLLILISIHIGQWGESILPSVIT